MADNGTWVSEHGNITEIKKYIDMMSGSIAVQTIPHIGTRIVIDIPVAVDLTPDVEYKSIKSSSEVHGDMSLYGKKILLAEYNEHDAELMAEIFRNTGADTVIASNGEVAVDLYSQSDECYFDAIFMDIAMPKIDGITASKQIRHLDRPDASKVPIITMTADEFDDYRQPAREAGVSAYLTKPIYANALMSVLKTVL